MEFTPCKTKEDFVAGQVYKALKPCYLFTDVRYENFLGELGNMTRMLKIGEFFLVIRPSFELKNTEYVDGFIVLDVLGPREPGWLEVELVDIHKFLKIVY